MDFEHRKYRRVEWEIPLLVSAGGSLISGKTINISRGGLLLEIGKNIPEYTVLGVNLTFTKEGKDRAVFFEATAIRVERVSERLYRVGMFISYISEADKRQLNRLIELAESHRIGAR